MFPKLAIDMNGKKNDWKHLMACKMKNELKNFKMKHQKNPFNLEVDSYRQAVEHPSKINLCPIAT